ncbi:MAG: putative septum site-determining protein MinC [Clostridia bacterium 41_269]|nr:MAG: putative septum site-determining protein MinC [Clostridia bacterium 41_269]
MPAFSIKGTKNGLVICIEPRCEFEEIKRELINKLEKASNFFKGARFNIFSAGSLSAEQLQILKNICLDRGMTLDTSIVLPTQQNNSHPQASAKDSSGTDNIILRKNIRSGQIVTAPKDLVIVGNVNPGAELIAGGSIIVMGSLRGTVHAGAFGDDTAVVFAHEMQPSQIRIAQFVACSPDTREKEKINYPEIAYVSNNMIVIEKYKKEFLNAI